jgi:hypothetical protein
MVSRVLYRCRQFIRSLCPRVDPALREEAFRLLREPERRLFTSMTVRDQQHCLEVYRRLRDEGYDDPDLLTAALLHDVGKGRIALWHRVAFVLLEGAPWLLDRLVRPGDDAGWRAALYRCRHHARLGAELARAAGCSERVVALIGERQTGDEDVPLAALKAADDAV